MKNKNLVSTMALFHLIIMCNSNLTISPRFRSKYGSLLYKSYYAEAINSHDKDKRNLLLLHC